jgi:hypothetical protein
VKRDGWCHDPGTGEHPSGLSDPPFTEGYGVSTDGVEENLPKGVELEHLEVST